MMQVPYEFRIIQQYIKFYRFQKLIVCRGIENEYRSLISKL